MTLLQIKPSQGKSHDQINTRLRYVFLTELPEMGRLSLFLEAVRSLFFRTFQFRFKQSIKVSVFKISVSLFFVGTERVS